MWEKLNSIKRRYEEIERMLGEPEMISDKVKYQKLAKEFSELSPLVSKYRHWEQLTEELQKLEGLLKKEKDNELIELIKSEVLRLKEKKAELEGQLKQLLLGGEEDRVKNIIVEIRAGTGGQEASLFAADLYRMYTRFANRYGWKIEVMSIHPTELGGFKEIIFCLKGKGAYRNFKFESGIHRVQRVPATETSGRIHTSAVSVAVLPEPEEEEFSINPKDLRIDVFRSSGPGGQSVNTADSAIRITHLPTGLMATCQDERSQLKNKIKAMRVLRARLLDRQKCQEKRRVSYQRRTQIGTGDRSEKVRTYNFPERRVTDHRIGLTLHKLEDVLEGNLDELISSLIAAESEARIK